MTCEKTTVQYYLPASDACEPMVREYVWGSEDGKHERNTTPDGFLAIKHRPVKVWTVVILPHLVNATLFCWFFLHSKRFYFKAVTSCWQKVAPGCWLAMRRWCIRASSPSRLCCYHGPRPPLKLSPTKSGQMHSKFGVKIRSSFGIFFASGKL